jgi:crotonobetainyl-CoA:carnitine CoA-transferase CaiB-like acyl-CoA transferase
VVGRFTAGEFRAKLLAAGIAFGGLNSVEQLSTHAALRRRSVATSDGTRLEIPAPPVQWAGEGLQPGAGTPKVGAQTDAIRAEFGPAAQGEAGHG